MAKFEEVSDETREIFETVIELADLERYGVNFKLIGNDRQKKLVDVKKANEVNKYLNDIDVFVYINDLIFIQLITADEKLAEMAAIEAITGVHYDTEKEKLVINKPDVTTYSGVLSKYGYEAWNVKEQSIKSLYDKKKNDDAENGEEG